MNIRLALLVIILCSLFAFGQKLTTTQPTVVCDTTTITNCATVAGGALAMTGTVNQTQWNGTNVATNSGTLDAGTLRVVLATNSPTMTNAQPVTLPANTAFNMAQVGGSNTSVVSAGVQKVAIVDSTGNPISSTTDPCAGGLTTLVAGSLTADTQIIGLAGAGTKHYYCSIALNNGSTTDEKVSIVESTTGGGTCTVAPSVILGGATDATGWRVANGGGGVVLTRLMPGPLTNAATCLKVDTGGLQIDYQITYVNGP
jgi:hypothetical protein